MLKDWNTCAREVGRALSRYDGHTTYAKLETILGVLGSALFDEKPSCYATELISDVEAQGIGRVAAQAHLRHGISLGFLERATSAGGISSGGRKTKINEMARIALSPLGRAYRAAQNLGDLEFRRFLVTGAILHNDFDLYSVFLKSALEMDGTIDASEFGRHFKDVLRKRQEWFEREIPTRPAREQIRGLVPWMPRIAPNALAEHSLGIKDVSIRYHFNMRRQWAQSEFLSHIGKDKSLTDSGRALAERIITVVEANHMLWIAPDPECSRKIGIRPDQYGAIHSAWELLRPDKAETAPDDELLRQVDEFMEKAFGTIRLRVFPQAPLAAIIPFVHFQESRIGQRVNLRDTFKLVLRRRGIFHCLLSQFPAECHYQMDSRSLASGAPSK